MYHQQLERQIKKYLDSSLQNDEGIKKLLTAVSQSYNNYERDKELSDHAFSISEKEYRDVNNRLKKMTEDLEEMVSERTKELSDIAQFPLENPNPIFRVSIDGAIIFYNPPAALIQSLIYCGNEYSVTDFFFFITQNIPESGSIEVTVDHLQFLFYYRKVQGKKYINFYGADVTETNSLRVIAQENYQRLRSFLEKTEDIFYIIYDNHKEKNLVTSKWANIFGFDHTAGIDIFKERSKHVKSESAKKHIAHFEYLEVGEQKEIIYQFENIKTGELFWLSESISRYYDENLNDFALSGRIKNITTKQLYSMQIREGEERFRNLIESVPVMVWVSNENNVVTYSNNTLKKFLGFSLENMKDFRDYISFVHPSDRNIAITEWKKNIERKKPVQSEYRLRNAKGKYHNILEKAVPRFYSDGKFAGYIGAYFDLTKEKEFRNTLTLEKEKLELMTQNSPDIIILTDQLGIVEYVSPTTKRILGYSEKEMLKKNLKKFICKECIKQLENQIWLKSKKNDKSKFEYRMIKSNGEMIWVESVISIIQEKNKDERKYLMHNRDINAIKEAEQVLIESEQKYRGLFENMHLGVMEVDLNDNIVWVNKSFEELSGYTKNQLKGKNASKTFLVESNSIEMMKDISVTRFQRKDSIYEIKIKKKNGNLLDVVISGSPIIDINGNVRGSVGIHWDVSEIRRMEKIIEEEKIIRQNEVMKATLNAEEQQKEILGNELHDGVGHILTYTSLFLQMAANAEKFGPELFLKAHKNVEKAINEVRRISRTLVPAALTDLGLKEAIIELFYQFSDVKNIKFTLDANSKHFSGLSFEAQRTIYRIVQEMVNNAVKYSKCNKINLSFNRDQSLLSIKFNDNGIGFNLNKLKKGLGLKSINNRVYFYGGTSQIKSIKGKGTSFLINFPLKSIKEIVNKQQIKSVNQKE